MIEVAQAVYTVLKISVSPERIRNLYDRKRILKGLVYLLLTDTDLLRSNLNLLATNLFYNGRWGSEIDALGIKTLGRFNRSNKYFDLFNAGDEKYKKKLVYTNLKLLITW